jgi:outer membrane protein assembly factor BamB
MTRRQVMCVLGGSFLAPSVNGANWPQFRGPQSQGISPEGGLPLEWSSTQNVRWKTALPGPGHSSPIVWGDRVFLTAFRPQRGGQLLVLSINKTDGKIVWERDVPVERIEQVHSTNAPASPTPVTDGTLVYAYFGSKGLVAFDFAGNRKWELPLGPFPNEWGSASSPVLYKDMLLLNVDTDGQDFLLALDRNTGKQIWRSRRDATRAWPTPFVWNAEGKDQIVVSGSRRVVSYDPSDGHPLWTVEGLTQWVTPTPVAAHGLVYVASNGPGGNVIMAIRPNSHVAWKYERTAPYSSSPVVVGDYLYAVKNGGIMVCLNAKDGAEQWVERLPARGDYFASPVVTEDRIIVMNDDGEVTVVAAKPQFQVLASNNMGERCMASPAISDGRLLIRTDENLYCIGSA